MYSRRGLLGCSMDFVTLHYQFSNIEFYEPNALQQEPHIKMLACFLHQMWLSSCFCLLDCLHLLFLWQNLHPDSGLFLLLFPLATASDTALHLRWWPPTACSKPNHDSHITDCAFAVSFFFLFLFFSFVTTKAWKKAGGWHHLELGILNWTNPSPTLFAEIDFPSVPTCVSIGKGWNFYQILKMLSAPVMTNNISVA